MAKAEMTTPGAQQDGLSSAASGTIPEVTEAGPISNGAEVAGQPTTRIVDTERQLETFIPVTRFAIIEQLCKDSSWSDGNSEKVRHFFSCLAAIRNLDYTKRLLDLKEVYLPFSPDRDTVRAQHFSSEEFAALQKRLTGLLRRCLEGANYRQITPAMIDEIFEERSAYGLDLEVDLIEYDELMIFSRGATVKTRTVRSWKTLYLKRRTETIPIFQRLFLLLKLKPEEQRIQEIMLDEDLNELKAGKRLKKIRAMLPKQASSDFIYLKLFKQIPRADLQMMFPNTRVKFKLKDKLFLGATAGGGTIMSIVSAAGKIALVLSNPIKALGALVGLGGVVFRQIMKFFNQKNQYMVTLAQNLYFHNLADNRGVLTLLADRAEEEDIKEEMLLYALLARGPLKRSELGEAQEAIEHFLLDEFQVSVQFDIDDALARLIAEGIVKESAGGGFETLSPEEGCAHLQKTWAAHLKDDGSSKGAAANGSARAA